MGIIRTFLGPKSKYDKSLPYTYMAKVPVIEGDEEMFSHYLADTICGLIEFLVDNKIEPEDAQLFSIYLSKEIALDKELCVDREGKWIRAPRLCGVLEEHYEKTKDLRYKGHVEKHDCAFDDRDTQGEGPF